MSAEAPSSALAMDAPERLPGSSEGLELSPVPEPRDGDQLAEVTQLYPDVTPFTGLALHYAPVENAELQARDNMRHRLHESVIAIRGLREERQQASAEGKIVPRLPYSVDVIKQNEQLARTTNIMFWFDYYAALNERGQI